MPIAYDMEKDHRPSSNKYLRVLSSILGQNKTTMLCPETSSLTGKLALVTGGNRGIGLEITKGLARRGANVIVAARGTAGSSQKCKEIAAETGVNIEFCPLDLSDKASVGDAVLELKWQSPEIKVDIFLANAGISESKNLQNNEGVELCFAVNCLGHHRLLKAMLENGCLADDARVIFTTGDIYILADDCSPDFAFGGRSISAYSRSKLGNLWQHYEMTHRYPELKCIAVHPGVVPTEFEGSIDGFIGFIKRKMFISPVLGAQATLIAATQDLPSGSYFHNKHGIMKLAAEDVANNDKKRLTFWKALNGVSV